MSTDRYAQERAVALEAVREAATLCQSVQALISPAMLKKKDRSPVTVADFGSQALVCRTLKARFPADPIIAEEDAAVLRQPENAAVLEKVVGHVQKCRAEADAETVCTWINHGGAQAYSDRFWTLDPIDGTKGFLRGEQYAVALALIVEGEVVVAALACPNLSVTAGAASEGVIYTAVKGSGVTAEPLDGTAGSVVAVSDVQDPSVARFCESVESGHSSHSDAADVAERLGITTEPARLDSQAKYAVVARGEATIYMRLPTRPGYIEKIWDHAAGLLVVEEAGGRVTDISGRPLDFSHGYQLVENRGVIATNGHVHDAVLEALAAVGVK